MSLISNIEIKKLWFVAKKYNALAKNEKSRYISKQELELTVKDLIDIIINKSDLNKYRHVIYLSAHLTSCAIRLYSLEEDRNSEWFRAYNDIRRRRRGNLEEINREIRSKLNNYIHFILRHNTAHAESKKSEYTNQEEALTEIFNILLSLKIKEIYDSMQELMKEMKKELES